MGSTTVQARQLRVLVSHRMMYAGQMIELVEGQTLRGAIADYASEFGEPDYFADVEPDGAKAKRGSGTAGSAAQAAELLEARNTVAQLQADIAARDEQIEHLSETVKVMQADSADAPKRPGRPKATGSAAEPVEPTPAEPVSALS